MKHVFKALLVCTALMSGLAKAQLEDPIVVVGPGNPDLCQQFPCLGGCPIVPSCYNKSMDNQGFIKLEQNLTIDQSQVHYVEVSAQKTTYLSFDLSTGQVDLMTHSFQGSFHQRTFNDALKLISADMVKGLPTVNLDQLDADMGMKAGGCGSAIDNLIDAIQDYRAVSDSGNQELINAALNHVADMYSIFLDCHLQ